MSDYTDEHYFEMINHLEHPIILSPVSSEDLATYKLCGDVVIPPSTNKRMLPKINLQEDNVFIAARKKKDVTAVLSELDISSVGLSTESSIVQRLQIVDAESNITVGYLSFRISVFQIRPIMTSEACEGYKIGHEMYPIGLGGTHISIKKDTGSQI